MTSDERRELDHAAAAADHVLALIVAVHPTFRVTPDWHDAMVARAGRLPGRRCAG